MRALGVRVYKPKLIASDGGPNVSVERKIVGKHAWPSVHKRVPLGGDALAFECHRHALDLHLDRVRHCCVTNS
mgnify:CR=1 FL=1